MRSRGVAPITNIIHTLKRATRPLNRPLEIIYTHILEIAAMLPNQPTKDAAMTV